MTFTSSVSILYLLCYAGLGLNLSVATVVSSSSLCQISRCNTEYCTEKLDFWANISTFGVIVCVCARLKKRARAKSVYTFVHLNPSVSMCFSLFLLRLSTFRHFFAADTVFENFFYFAIFTPLPSHLSFSLSLSLSTTFWCSI